MLNLLGLLDLLGLLRLLFNHILLEKKRNFPFLVGLLALLGLHDLIRLLDLLGLLCFLASLLTTLLACFTVLWFVCTLDLLG